MNSTARGTHESPNIYTREIDVSSYVAKSLGITSLGLVGETLIGPAFQPIPISTYNEFKTYFGGTSPEKYTNGYPKYELGYVAKSYLEQSQQLYVTRVLGLSGYQYSGLWALYIQSGSTKNLFATLRSKSYYSGETLVPHVSNITLSTSGITGTSVEFIITAEINNPGSLLGPGEGEMVNYNVSLNPSNKNYILKVLGGTLNGSSTSKIFVEEMYEGVVDNSINTGTTFYNGMSVNITGVTGFNNYKQPFSYAKTPWFVSEIKGGSVIPLFRFLTLSDGDNANNLYKISIRNIDLSTLTFDVLVRAIYDTDDKPNILEEYTNCSLNPIDGNNYLGAKIGTVDEVYKLKSKYVVVEILDDNSVRESVPMGFEGYPFKNISGMVKPDLNYNISYVDTGSASAKKPYFGVTNSVDSDMFTYKGLAGTGKTKGFHLEPTIGAEYTTLSGSTYVDYVQNDKKLRKFTAYFAGGFDGWDIFRANRTNTSRYQFNNYKLNYNSELTNNFTTFGDGELNSNYGIPDVPVTTGMTSDFYAFWSAARTFADPEFVDINVFATPGIDWKNNELLVNEIIDMIESERKDSIYVVTTPDKNAMSEGGITITDAKTDMISASKIVTDLESTGIDSSYATTNYPWFQYYDNENGVYVFLPVTKDVVKNMAYTDNTAYAWFPPAGIGRGNVDCVKAKKSLVLSEEDILSKGRINFVKTFALDGVKIWGQRTLQIADTALNRIGVRRMMLYLRKQVRRSNLPLIFEPNDNTTKNKFNEIVNPILNSIKTNRGISEYDIKFDESEESRARHEMNVRIWVKPIGALEFISIDFMITDEGFDFSTI